MYQHLTKLLLAGVVAVALLATGSTSILAPAWAKPLSEKATLGDLKCTTTGQIARFNGTVWECSDAVTDLEAQIDDLLFLASGSRFIFISSSLHTGDFGGVDAADAECNVLADAAGLPGTYKAWLADHFQSSAPRETFIRAPGPYILPGPGGAVVADDWMDLTDGTLNHAIDTDETGAGPVGGEVWSNVLTNGARKGSLASDSCDDWTDDGENANVGRVIAGQSTWTDFDNVNCVDARPFYCVGN